MERSALKIYSALLGNGEIQMSENRDLYMEYRRQEVRDDLDMMREELGFAIVDSGRCLYLVPAMDNTVLNYTAAEMREEISSQSRMVDLYLQNYIIMVILCRFYGGKNTNPVQAEFLLLRDIAAEIDRRLQPFEDDEKLDQQDPVDGREIDRAEEEDGINYRRIADIWFSKQAKDEGKRKTKIGTVQTACRFLERQRLVKLVDNASEIRPTARLTDLMLYYYLSEERVEAIHGIFRSLE